MTERERARDAIRNLLLQDPERFWDCKEVAKRLSLTARTVVIEVNALCWEGTAQKTYGWRRKLKFRARKDACRPPRWLAGLYPEDLALLNVKSSFVHRIEDDDE